MTPYRRTWRISEAGRFLQVAASSLAALLLSLVLITSSVYAQAPGENQDGPRAYWDCTLRDYLAEILPIHRAFSDGVARASSVPAGALYGEVATMQQARDRLAQVDPPPCARDTAQRLGQAMDDTISGFVWFDSGDRDTAHAYLARGWDEHKEFEAELGALIDREVERARLARSRPRGSME